MNKLYSLVLYKKGFRARFFCENNREKSYRITEINKSLEDGSTNKLINVNNGDLMNLLYGGIKTHHKLHIESNHANFILREDVIDCINYFNNNLTKNLPACTILYGNEGTGKTTSMYLISKYLSNIKPSVFVHFASMARWTRSAKSPILNPVSKTYEQDYSNKMWIKSLIDSKLSWLNQLNIPSNLKKDDEKIDFISFLNKNINKIKSTELMTIIVDELIELSKSTNIFILASDLDLFIDPLVKFGNKPKTKYISPQSLEFYHQFKKLTSRSNGIKKGGFIFTINKLDMNKKSLIPTKSTEIVEQLNLDICQESLLIKETKNFNGQEFGAMIDYYMESGIINQKLTNEQVNELKVLSGLNPKKLFEMITVL